MKIFHISDPHLDFHIKNAGNISKISAFVKKLIPPEKTKDGILIIPGDISHYNHLSIAFLTEIKKYFKEVFVTAGNHDLYLVSKNIMKKYGFDSFKRLKEFKEMCVKNGIHYMEGNVFEINGIRICGLPGWYKVKNIAYWESVMNDANYILKGTPKITIPTLYGRKESMHSFSPLEYFDEQFKIFDSLKGKIDILFSHVPFIDVRKKHLRSDEFYWWTDSLSEYAEEKMKELNVKHYIFGHVHEEYKTEKNRIKIHSFPLGYKCTGQKTAFFEI